MFCRHCRRWATPHNLKAAKTHKGGDLRHNRQITLHFILRFKQFWTMYFFLEIQGLFKDFCHNPRTFQNFKQIQGVFKTSSQIQGLFDTTYKPSHTHTHTHTHTYIYVHTHIHTHMLKTSSIIMQTSRGS